MAIWNNNTCNSHREFYKKYGTTPLNAQGVNNLSYFDQYILQNGSKIVNSIFLFIGQNVDFDGSSSSSKSSFSSGGAEEIQARIDEILNKYGDKGYDADNVDELEALLEVYEGEKVENDEKLNSVKEGINQNNIAIGNIETDIDGLKDNILKLEGQIAACEENSEEASNLKSELDAKKRDLAEAEKNLAALKEKQKDLAAQKAVLDDDNEDLEELGKDIQKLKTYMKQLKKAGGRDAINGLVNEATGNITDLIDKYNRNPGDTNLKDKLEGALKEYVYKTENPSPTIVKYAAIKFGIEKKQ